MPRMTTNRNTGLQLLLLLAAALSVWALLLALGAYLGPEYWAEKKPDNRPAATAHADDAPPQALTRPFDYRKPIIVTAFMAIFLGGWGLALYLRHRRLQQDAKGQNQGKPG